MTNRGTDLLAIAGCTALLAGAGCGSGPTRQGAENFVAGHINSQATCVEGDRAREFVCDNPGDQTVDQMTVKGSDDGKRWVVVDVEVPPNPWASP